MKIAILSIGAILQAIALYIAFYSDINGNIYLATLVSVLSICCLIAIRSLFAPACLLAGVLVGLSLSHNKVDLMLVTQWEKNIHNALRADFVQSPNPDWALQSESKLSATLDNELILEPAVNSAE